MLVTGWDSQKQYIKKSILYTFIKKKRTVGRKRIKNENPIFISIQIIVQKWILFQSTWLIVYFNFMLYMFSDVFLFMVGSLTNFHFFNVNPKIWQWNIKVQWSNYLDTNFHNISDFTLRVINYRNHNIASFLEENLLLC